MTANDLRDHLVNLYGISQWPEGLKVDHETYANVCQYIFDQLEKQESMFGYIRLYLGPHHGVMFKGVELRLEKSND